MTGNRGEVIAAAGTGARVIDARSRAVIPGLHDAHLHLVDLARSRRGADLADAVDFRELLSRVAGHVASLAPGEWVHGRGWSADSLDPGALDRLEDALAGRPAFLRSRDGHSAWASAEVLRRASIGAQTPNPAGGVIERRPDGAPNGILRETAVDLARPIVEQLRGAELRKALEETASLLSKLGITGATDAGDFDATGGEGRYAALGDSFSALYEAVGVLGGRLRLNINVPMAAIADAASLGLRTGEPLDGVGPLRAGWVKVFADGALGSRTAALLEPYSCPAGNPTGLMTVTAEALDEVISVAEGADLRVATHAIGDRANALVIDAFERAASRATSPGGSGARHRIEHVQLIRPRDAERLASLGLIASMQPIHCPSDRVAIERCWAGRTGNAYAWRSVADARAVLAFGSDAPVETVNPWSGIHAALHRRLPGEVLPFHPEQALTLPEALSAYTIGPAHALDRPDEGHLRVGARADLAVLDRDLSDLLSGDADLPGTRAELTLVDGREV